MARGGVSTCRPLGLGKVVCLQARLSGRPARTGVSLSQRSRGAAQPRRCRTFWAGNTPATSCTLRRSRCGFSGRSLNHSRAAARSCSTRSAAAAARSWPPRFSADDTSALTSTPVTAKRRGVGCSTEKGQVFLPFLLVHSALVDELCQLDMIPDSLTCEKYHDVGGKNAIGAGRARAHCCPGHECSSPANTLIR